ncbi:MAG: glycosyltransferase family 2 protein [Christiangramia sp.]|nr:glycosyltransferase family 2 protein [Christiangramia sp.]
MPHISIVSPVYKAEKIIPILVERIARSVEKITSDYEIILVEDASPDGSWEAIEKVVEQTQSVTGIKLSRNFGQHYAITAGLDHAHGEWVIVMDCDLQDEPEEFENLYNKAIEGYDIVLARRHERKDHFLKRLSSKAFYKTLGYLTGSEQDNSIANYGIYRKEVIQAVKSMRESIRYFPTMIQWVGFKVAKVDVRHNERLDGQSSYNLSRLLNLAFDIILAYSVKPIQLLIKFGLIISLLSVLIAVVYVIKWLKGDVVVIGYTSLIVSIWLLSGIIISTLGIIGIYVGKTFEGVKKRPLYIISKKTN